MTTNRAAALIDAAPASVAADPDLNPSDRGASSLTGAHDERQLRAGGFRLSSARAPTEPPVRSRRCAIGWLERPFGLVFRKIDRWGTLEHHRLGTDAIRRIVARRAQRRARRPHQAGERAARKGGAG
jgi:hypothetical protein